MNCGDVGNWPRLGPYSPMRLTKRPLESNKRTSIVREGVDCGGAEITGFLLWCLGDLYLVTGAAGLWSLKSVRCRPRVLHYGAARLSLRHKLQCHLAHTGSRAHAAR